MITLGTSQSDYNRHKSPGDCDRSGKIRIMMVMKATIILITTTTTMMVMVTTKRMIMMIMIMTMTKITVILFAKKTASLNYLIS